MAKKDVSEAYKLAKTIAVWIVEAGFKVFADTNTAKVIGCEEFSWDEFDKNPLDCVIVLSGDGTLLSVARKAAKYSTPLLGINLGHLGFLAEIDPDDYLVALECLKSGSYHLEERIMIEARVIRDGKVVANMTALNDVVVSKGAFARIIRLDTYVNDNHFGGFLADGMIVATPTGSTAYSLSAGGPLVTPNLDVLLITPICAHTLFSRALVISGSDIVRIELDASHRDIALTIDGQMSFELLTKDQVEIRKSDNVTHFIRMKKGNFYDTLRERLKDGKL